MSRSLVVLLLALAGSMVWSLAPTKQRHLIAGANVAMRAAPGTQSSRVANIRLGSEVIELQRDAASGWYRVQTTDGREGWVSSDLVRPFDPARPLAAQESLIEDRLARRDASFAERAELVEFVEYLTVYWGGSDMLGRIAWYRLRALAAALAAIPKYRDNTPEINQWMPVRGDYISIWSAPAARWMLRPELVSQTSLNFHGTSAAEDLA